MLLELCILKKRIHQHITSPANLGGGFTCLPCNLVTAPVLGSSQSTENRPLAASAASGSISSLLVWVLHEALHPSGELPSFPPLDCGVEQHWQFWAGLVVGFFLWPILEVLVLAKQYITLSLRARISQVGWQPGKHYKILS